MEPGPYDKSCFEVSKKMIMLLRHDPSALREEDGAVEFRILAQMFCSGFTSSSHSSIRTCLSFLQRGGGIKKRFQYCVDPTSPEALLYFRAIQGHSVGKHVDPSLQRQRVFYRTTSPSGHDRLWPVRFWPIRFGPSCFAGQFLASPFLAKISV